MIHRPDIEQLLKVSDLYIRIRNSEGKNSAEIGPRSNYIKRGSVISEQPHSVKLILEDLTLGFQMPSGYDSAYEPHIKTVVGFGDGILVGGSFGRRLNSVFPASGVNYGGQSFYAKAARIISSPLSRDVEPF